MYVDMFLGSLWSFQCVYVCGCVSRLLLEFAEFVCMWICFQAPSGVFSVCMYVNMIPDSLWSFECFQILSGVLSVYMYMDMFPGSL
jgi:hypothetical protein